jgi:archaetidylinositol phosphate synthase
MTLDQYRDVARRIADPLVERLARLGVGPDPVSLVAVALAGGAGLAFALAGGDPRLYLVGAALVLANGVLDMLDGELARRLDVDSRAGDLLDHVLDRYADIAVIVGLAAGVDRYGLGLAAVTGVLMTSYMGTQIEAVGLDRAYGGLVGRADRLVLVGVTAVVAWTVPDFEIALGLTVVGVLLVLFAIVGHLTALQRFFGAYGDLG